MFHGLIYQTIDEKGRIIVPAKFREIIKAGGSSGVMVTRMDGCLYAYPYEAWAEVQNRILTLAEKNEIIRRFRRIFIGGAFDLGFDKQGRMLIPPSLREYAGLEKEIAVVGAMEHFEIWSKDNLEQEYQTLLKDMEKDEVKDQIAKLGL